MDAATANRKRRKTADIAVDLEGKGITRKFSSAVRGFRYQCDRCLKWLASVKAADDHVCESRGAPLVHQNHLQNTAIDESAGMDDDNAAPEQPLQIVANAQIQVSAFPIAHRRFALPPRLMHMFTTE